MPYVFLKKATKILTLLAALTGGTLGLQAMKVGQGDLSPNRIIGSVPENTRVKKGLGFQAFLAQSGKAFGRNLVQLVAKLQRPDRRLVKIRQKATTPVAGLPMRLTAKASPLSDLYATQGSVTLGCPGVGAILTRASLAGGSPIGQLPGSIKDEIPISKPHYRPEVCPVGRAQDDMRRLRRILDLFRPTFFTGRALDRPRGLRVGPAAPEVSPQRIRFAIDLASASAPLTHGRLGACLALCGNRSRDDWS